MKKLFLLLALLGIVATGCSKDEGGNILDDAYISLNKEIVTISPDGESVDVKVYSNYAWELTNNCDWITTSITSGDASDTGVTVTLTADPTYDDRDGTILFSCGKAKKLLVVSQKFKEAIIPDANDTFNIPVEGGVAVITYQTTVDCEVIIPEEAQDWITIAPATRGLVSESINLDIAENTTYSARTAVVKVVAKDNAEIFVKYTINQEQKNGVLVDGNNTFTVPGIGGSVLINYQANVDCEVIIPDEAQDWVIIAPATRGLSTYSTTLNIAENNSGEERSCVIKIVSKDNNKLSAEYTIVQNPRYCLYYTSSNSKIVTPYKSSAFGATILSNTYIDGVGVIEFNAPITTIGSYAFFSCDSLTSLTIPDSVTMIGECAFAACRSLQEFNGKFASEDGRCLIIDGVLNSFAIGCGATEYTIPDSVTTIGRSAFWECNSLTSVTIPDSVTEIGYDAFRDCSSLTSVTIGDSVTTIGYAAFGWCESLTSVYCKAITPPAGDSLIFYHNASGRKIYVPIESVNKYKSASGWSEYATDIVSYDFENGVVVTPKPANNEIWYTNGSTTEATTPNKTNAFGANIASNTYDAAKECWVIKFDGEVTTIGNYAFEACYDLTSVTIPDSVTTIGNYAFEYCYRLTSITIPNSVTTIGYHAFDDCSSLTSVTIPDSVTTIGNYAFEDCSSLTSVTIPDSVTTIGNYAFQGCTSLTSVTIPDSVTTIGTSAFSGCSLQEFKSKFASEDGRCLIIDGTLNSFAPAGLTEYTIPDSVTTIGNGAFDYCYDLTSITIPDSVTEIGYCAFRDCDSLTSVTIPDSVTTIGEDAFQGCSSLTSVTIPDSVTTIGNCAFEDCSSLTSVTIPDSVTEIGYAAFYDCVSLTSVYCKATTPPAGDSDMFDGNASGRKIYVPMESVEAYKSEWGWSEYKSYIVGYNF